MFIAKKKSTLWINRQKDNCAIGILTGYTENKLNISKQDAQAIIDELSKWLNDKS